MTDTVGIIGVGHLACYLVEGLRGADEGLDIVLSPRNAGHAAALAERFACRVAADNAEVVEAAKVVIMAPRPQHAVEATAGLPWSAGHTIVSVVAGVPVADFRRVAGPAAVVRTMPVICAAIGACPTTMYPENAAARRMLTLLGTVHVLPDEAVFEAASVLGAVYGWINWQIREYVNWSIGAGLPPEMARDVVAHLFGGAAGMVLARPEESLDDALVGLTTPGGITEHGLKLVDERGALGAWSDACQSVLDRLNKGS